MVAALTYKDDDVCFRSIQISGYSSKLGRGFNFSLPCGSCLDRPAIAVPKDTNILIIHLDRKLFVLDLEFSSGEPTHVMYLAQFNVTLATRNDWL